MCKRIDYVVTKLKEEGHKLVQIKTNSYNLSCPLCEVKNSYKKRGYLLGDGEYKTYFCHNDCGGMSLYNFMYNVFGIDEAKKFYKDTHIGEFKDRTKPKQYTPQKKFVKDVKKGNKTKLIPYNKSDKVMKFVKSRCIEPYRHEVYEPNGKDAVMFIIKDFKGNINGYQMRYLNEKRFKTKFTNNDAIKVYNLHNIKDGSTVYVFESIIDGMSSGLDKGMWISSLGADMGKFILKSFDERNISLVFCYDNDKTGREKTIKYSNMGYKVVNVSFLGKYKDINEALCDGYLDRDELRELILNNTFTPLSYKLSMRGKVK